MRARCTAWPTQICAACVLSTRESGVAIRCRRRQEALPSAHCGPMTPMRPWPEHTSGLMQDINGILSSQSGIISSRPICTIANRDAYTSSQRCGVSARLAHDQHAGGKGPAAHWRRSGVCRGLERLQWTRQASTSRPMQQLQCDSLQPHAPTRNAAQDRFYKSPQALSTRRVLSLVCDIRAVTVCLLCQTFLLGIVLRLPLSTQLLHH